MSRPEACCITLKVERRNIPPVFEERGTTTVDQITHNTGLLGIFIYVTLVTLQLLFGGQKWPNVSSICWWMAIHHAFRQSRPGIEVGFN